MEKPIVDKQVLVQKRDIKGGWTYVAIDGIPASERNKLGLIRVRGYIDGYEFKQFHLLPMKDGNMLLPIKTAARKKIKKKEGDTVRVVLFLDDSAIEIPDDILVCLLDSEKAYQFFLSMSESNQKHYIDWIEESKRIETKAVRIMKMIVQLEKGQRFWDWPQND